MWQFLNTRIPLIALAFLVVAGCADSGSGAPAVDAADPGTRPYPNLGAFPPLPSKPPAARLEAERQTLARQREAAQTFDARLRAIDPVLDPAARPPEPPALDAAPAPPAAPVARPAPPPVAPAHVAAPAPMPAFAPVPSAPAANLPLPVAQAIPVPASIASPVAPRPASRVAAPVAAPASAMSAVPGARTGWIVGDIDFAEGSAQLSREARRTLRDAVVAAQERGGRVRLTPAAGAPLSPPEQALGPRRLAAASGELEALGLDRARIYVDPGTLRTARVAVEF